MEPLHPMHAILLAFPLPLFLSALLSDIAYWSSYHIQWINFAAWLIAGGVIVGAFTLLWALIDVARNRRTRSARPITYLVTLAVMWGLGLVNAFVHAKDAWATMPEGLWLSVVVTLLAFVTSWLGYSGLRSVEVD